MKNPFKKDSTISGSFGIPSKRADELIKMCVEYYTSTTSKEKFLSDDIAKLIKNEKITLATEGAFVAVIINKMNDRVGEVLTAIKTTYDAIKGGK